ncbi:ESPR-type extended signal peptide-containing protein [Veillonella sp.]|uniref:ESPR-type extended signal peptide-containing protein n=1 Tax=Veillonella sp. TaxID=1926307 RepID=UPI0028FF7A71|nr:ESPR-type extended signal peptide-containing protein [Veillonella sp.]MDU2302356.1 ESPR-type extended signal peptide-containing protein [Veillonella sp.]MDU2389197.1 ESPR-type extended signal peptide-containing protein [Veillonella sp.]
MNKIFKVIWSKSKQCYVVVSEMAKNKTGKKKIVVASILAALAMQVSVVDVSAADRLTGTLEGGTIGVTGLTNGLAIGNEAQSGSNQSIAIGYKSKATAPEVTPDALPATAVGAGAKANGYSTVALGLSAKAEADSATALGSKTSATGDRSVAVGISAAATADSATALGSKTSATGDRTVAVGSDANATGRYASAFGADASAVGNATAVGANSLASVDAAVAVGTDSKATGNYASALGGGATASNNDATAFGHGTVASGASSTALGTRAKAGALAAVGVGMFANATKEYSIAIGGESSSSADNSIAIGKKSFATGENGIAIGAFTTSKGANGVAVGTNGTTAELGGVAVGQAAKSMAENSVAVGMNVTAAGTKSVALGGSATANDEGTIAIGSYGTTATKASGNRALAIGAATTAQGLESIALGSRVNSTSQHSIAIGTGSNASAVRSIAIGADSRASVEGGVALGRDSVADVAGGVTNKGYNPNTNRTDIYSGLTDNVLTSTTGAVSIGNGTTVTRQLTGLAAGTRDTDAVNVAQLKSVNLAFSGNVNTGNVNIANSTLGLKGDNTYITTAANGQNLTISGKTQNIDVTNGQASANAKGMADSKNVADAINKAISANAYHWKLAAENTSTAPEVINKSDTVIFGGDNNITVTRSGKKITTSLNKAITVDTVKANRSVTVSSGGNQITLDGSNGAVTGRNFTGDSFKAGDNVLSNTTLQIGPTTGGNNVTITRDGLSAKAGSNTVKFGTNGISAGGQQITNVSSGGNIGTNAANITDVKNAVAAVTLNLDTNSKTGTVKLSESPLKVIGANGIRTDLVGTNNGSLVVGLDKSTVNATTKGIGLTGDTGSTGLKYLKDGDATFKVAGDGDLVTTKASATGVQVAVDSAKVKDLAVGAVTVSKANTADNPITVTPTAGTNSKDYAIGIDTTKLANQTQLTYKANGANANKVSLANGLNFTDGTFTKATVGTNGNVTISTATETITNDADGKAKVNSPTDGLATAKNVAESINKAVDGLSQNLTVSDGTTDGTVNLKNQKLTVSGTNGVTTTVNGQTVTVGLDATTKTKVDNASTAVAHNISLGADSGTASSQSLKDGDVAFNVKGATGDLVSTKMNGNTVEISTKRAAITGDANTGAASVTGDDGLATSKNVADAINKAADAAKAGAAWNLSANGDTGTKVSGGDTVDFTGDNNITVTQTGKNIATTLNKDLKKLSSISLEDSKMGVETITIDGGTSSAKFKLAGSDEYSLINHDGLVVSNGAAIGDPNEQRAIVGLDRVQLITASNNTALTSKNLLFNDEDGNLAEGSAKGFIFQSAAGKQVQFGVDEIKAGGNKIQEVAEGTADTDAVNVKQLKDTVGSQTLTYRANTAADADAKTVKLSKGLDFGDGTMTKATVDNDGKVTFDINDDTKTKINDSAAAVNRKVSLGADSGTTSSQSLKDGDVAFNVKGATGDFISTKMNGDTVEVSTKRSTINSDAAGTASVTGDDGLATAKNVADAINKAASQAKDGAAWKLSANGDTPTTVAGGDTVDFTGDNNITVTQTGKNIATTLNKDLKDLSTISLTNPRGESIFLDGGDGTIKAYKAEFKDNNGAGSSINSDILRFTNGATGANASETALSLDILSLSSGSNNSGLTSRELAFNDANGNESVHNAQGIIAESAGGAKTIQFTLDEINAGGNKIKEVAEGTDDTDAVNVKQLKDTVASQTLTYRANTAADTDAKSVKLSKGLDFVDGTMTKATVDNDGKVTFDINDDTKTKINDAAAAVSRKVSLGADSGTTSSQSLKDGDVAFNVKGATGDFISTKMNGNTVEVSTKRATIDSNATTGAASVTGDDGLATAKNVADAINKAAKASTDAINLKFAGDTNTSAGVVNLKDDTLGIKGDGKYVTTDADGKNLTVKVSEAEVKKSAVSAVTVSTDTTDADNPLTVTGTPSADGTTKDYKVTIDGAKVAAKTNLSYKANDGTAKQVSLADGLNFKDGTLTTATIDDAGVVKYDVKTAAITAGTDGTITGPATDGVATAKNVADAINAAKKASKTEITANDDEAANATTGNVKLTSTTAADGHTVYNVKLNDTLTFGTGANAIVIDGTAGKATIGSAAIDGVNNTITTGGNKAVTLDGTTGTITGKAANIGGVTVDGTNNHVTGLGNTTWDGNAVSGRAATEDQLKVVADAAANQTWQITADKDAATSGKQTGTKTDAKVGKDAKVTMIAGENITINQNERDFTYSLNKDLVNMNSASFNGTGNNTTVINGDSITQTAGTQTNTSTAAGNTVTDGTKSTATTADGTKITDGAKTNTSTADSTVIDDGNGNNTALTKDGVTITAAGKNPVSLTKDGLNNGGNKISNIADGTDDTDAVNVRQLEAKSKASKTELTANGGESAGSTTGNIVLTKTTAADGHIIYDNKLNDKVTLGTDPTKAVTVDGTTGTIKAGDGANAVAIDGKNGSVKAGDKIALDGKDGKATIGTVGIDGKDGIITTGGNNPVAVNGKDGVVTGLTNKTWDPNNIAPGRAATEDQVKSAVENAGWNATIGTEGSGVNSTPTATAEKVKTDETVTFKAGNNMMVSQAGKTISYAVNPELKDMKSATFKDAAGNTTVTDGNGITITPGSANPNNPNAGTISLTKDGLNNGNNQLKGIAPGTDDTDAVNVSQLKASNARIGDAIGQVAGEVQRVGAHAAAMAALKPIQYDPLEPTQVMAGVGNYRGETAAALGLAHYTNEDTMFNVGVSLGANRNMVNAGVTHKFGSSPEKKNIPDRYKAGPISSVYVMQDEVSSLKKENSEQKTVIADQAARLNTLEAENERQRQELAETKQGLEDLRAAVSQLLASKG